MKHALQESYGAVAKEKKYLHTRQAAAASGTLSQDELLQMLDMTNEDLIKITRNLTSFSSESSMPALWIEDRLNTSRSKALGSSAHMLEAIKHKVETLKSTHTDYD